MHTLVRRSTALLAVPALSLTALAATSAPAAAATDPAPAAASAAWLAGQVPDSGLFPSDYGPQYGLGIDVALGLHAVGGQEATVTRIRDAVEAGVNDYIAYSYDDKGVTHTGESGGSTAKVLVLAQRVGGDEHAFGGVDLVERLDSLVADSGRVISTADGAPDDSYDNTYIQALAAEGLRGTGSTAYAAAVDYLLDQQCPAGFFRGDIPAAPGAQSCGAGDEPDTDSTSQAVLALAGDATAPGVADALARAKTWLLDSQRANGAFGGGPTTEAPNTNSTGLAASALATLGATDAAADAASWIRAHQAANVANCVYYAAADLGAIAYDDAALKAIQSGGAIDAATQGQFLMATAQALPALQWAPAGTGEPHALFAAEYVRAGGFKPVGVIDAAPGEALCAMLGEQSVLGYADTSGEAQLRVRIPATTGKSRVTVANAAGTINKVTINALGRTRLKLTLKARVAPGAKQVIKIAGLAPGEIGTAKITWPAKGSSGAGEGASGQANGKGVLVFRTKVPNRPGKAKVVVRGQFAHRKAAGSFTVTR
ncbi:prenyltransferase/squalene oxidase repeat-containing protein [Nocardioides sp.]|uniref:prenyltransferase/squalene oxidase repeat-containing protein n=1 Tax=Nocardioides sp. TaxID=35761 RepID=UPI0025E33D99|nr:prenyltransferase/squalene oxidase repeat-containing protein [Nocardioides sp.]